MKRIFSLAALLLGILCVGRSTLSAQEILIMPYLQPGNFSLLKGGDGKVVAWMTDATPGDFRVEYEILGKRCEATKPVPVPLKIGNDRRYLLYRASLEGLPLDVEVRYRVIQSGKVIREASFKTRSSSGKRVKFVAVGDCGDDTPEARKIAFQMSRVEPDCGLTLGDVVYVEGLLRQYLANYADFYINTADPSPETGAPLFASVPFYQVIGNHDVRGYDLKEFEDGLAFFYIWHPPLNGPEGISPMPGASGPSAAVASFKKAAGPNYPQGARNYSFDNGPAHFLVLDANAYVNVADPVWRAWIEKDLMETKAKWKFVFFHQPGIHASEYHAEEQRMRAFSPLFEKCGVDVVFSGHVHNYQRSKPLKFQPSENIGKMAMALRVGRKSRVPGTFTLDETFDGDKNTAPRGVIYIVSGAGGRKLSDREFTDRPDLWVYDTPDRIPYTAKFFADRHSFSEVTADLQSVVLRQVDLNGREVDRIRITKP